MSIHENLVVLARNIPPHCTLIAVSKTQPLEKIKEAYSWGQRVFGENRAQEMAGKHEALPRDIAWHMIGHLQTNKVKYIVSFVSLIQSVDSFKLLEEINRQGIKVKRVIPCLLQVHIAEEEAKFGFSGQELVDLMSSAPWKNLENIRITGLMGMATFTENEQQVRKEFRSLKTLFEQLRSGPLPESVKMEELSMGMSGDFKIALEEGSTMVRIGTTVFGQRQ